MTLCHLLLQTRTAPRMKKFAKILLACLCLLLASVATLLGYSEWTVSDARHYTYDDVNAVPYNRVALVLGTSKYLIGGSPNHYFKYRIKAAAELYNNGKVDYILVSGDNATVQYNEPRQMRRALIQAGIPANAIYSDYAGFRTLDSIVRAKEVFGQAHFTVVSQAFHNERAIFIARHFGIEAVGFNAVDPSAYQGIKTRVREVFARLMGLLDLYVLDKGPKFLGEPIVIGGPVPCQALSTIGASQPCLPIAPPPHKPKAKPAAAVSAATSSAPATSAAVPSEVTAADKPAITSAATPTSGAQTTSAAVPSEATPVDNPAAASAAPPTGSAPTPQ
ncbi:ElyC/SanA/YdcF family protein [Aeromonas hydrophila]|uniref:SanA/YdcF family protein n=1 Tax=Aeromonas hydrophila TaxID=644 RepID=UPI00249F3265|nr:ElyC/SanA/YdcF family protein [Aeromonas hydrophila]WGY31847.1 ElyC/SanA/YdcF family protein [Aeromonas hydrophila]HDC4321946.1 YdcF family protein [Aeromonas hydrophila]